MLCPFPLWKRWIVLKLALPVHFHGLETSVKDASSTKVIDHNNRVYGHFLRMVKS
jgi:hypothetical protein